MSEIEAYIDPVGPTTWANTTAAGAQSASQTAALSGGGYVVVWQDTSQIPNSGIAHDIRGQVFDASGGRVGSEFLVDQSTGTATTLDASVAGTASGGFVVSWADSVNGTRARAFDQGGAALGNEFAVQDTLVNPVGQTSVASMADGHYLITWQERVAAAGSIPAHSVVRGKIYGADNVAVTNAFDVGTSNTTTQFGPSVAAVGDQFVLSWAQMLPAPAVGDSELYAQRISGTGTFLGGIIHVNTATWGYQYQASVAALADGSFVIAYASDRANHIDDTVNFQRFDHTGNKLGDETPVSGPIIGFEYGIRAIGLQDGNFIIGWTHSQSSTAGSQDVAQDIYAQEFLNDGTMLGPTIGYNTAPNYNDQPGDGLSYAVLSSGRIVTDWTDYNLSEGYPQNYRYGIRMQLGDPLKLLFGTDQSETLTATDSASAIEGRGGDDTIHGGAGNDQIDGGAGNDTIYGQGGNDTIYGGDGNDVIDGGAGNNTINGDAGNDTLVASGGSGSLYGGDGDDVLTATNGSFGFYGEDGNDRITVIGANTFTTIDGGGGNNVIQASGSGALFIQASGDNGSDDITIQWGAGAVSVTSAGNDTIRLTGSNAATIFVGVGHQVIVSSTQGGSLTINGFNAGEAGDTIDLSAFGTDPFGPGGPLVMSAGGFYDSAIGLFVSLNGVDTRNLSSYNLGGANNPNFHPQNMTLESPFSANPTLDVPDYLVAADGNDIVRGYGGNDTLYGGGGNDRLDGGLGADMMYGGTGNDTYVVDDPGDQVFEAAGAGNDTIEIGWSADLASFANFENITLTGTANIDATGNALANVLTGNSGNNHMVNEGAGDTLIGGAGDDIYVITDASTAIVEAVGGGNDTIKSYVSYVLGAGVDVETTRLMGSADINLTGNADHQILIGNAGNNWIDDGGAGAPDRMKGAEGNDVYVVHNSGDVIVEVDGNGAFDTVLTYVDYTMGAGVWVERLAAYDTASTTGLTLTGNDHTLFIQGAAGADHLTGGAGNETLMGYAGNDVLLGGGGADTFVFDHGTGQDTVDDFAGGSDKLDLSAFGFANFAAVQAASHDQGGNAVIDLGGGDSVTLTGVTSAQLQSGDVILGGGQSASLSLGGGAHTEVASMLPDTGTSDVAATIAGLTHIEHFGPVALPAMVAVA